MSEKNPSQESATSAAEDRARAWEEKKQRVMNRGGGGNVLVNGRTAVHAGSGGVLTTVDVCLTKIGKSTVPIPYTNIARSSDADKTAGSILINGHPACHKQSTFAKSSGDEPGNRKGVRSKTITEKAEFITAASTVFFEGVPAVRQGDLMVSNNRNTAPMPLVQPGAGAPPTLTLEGAEEKDEKEFPERFDLGHLGQDTSMLKGIFSAEDDL